MGKIVTLLLLGFLTLYADGPVLQTGQTTVYQAGDNGTYQEEGIARSYTRDANGTVTDNATGLVWQDDAVGSTMDWASAGGYCEDLTLGGQTDWRLPTVEELKTLVDYGKVSAPLIDDTTFQYVASNGYWSSTTVASVPSFAWVVVFNFGDGDWYDEGFSFYVRCVRSGQLVTSFSSSSVSSSSSSSESSSSSSVYIDPNQVYASVQVTQGWNLIAVPFNTNDEFDVSSLIQNMSTIGWKFKFISAEGDEYHWDKWERGVSLKLKNGEGLFVGIPHSILPSPQDYIHFQGIRTDTLLKFEDKTYLENKWYLLGFGYEVKVSDILALYPNAVVWVMENDAYKKLTNTDVIKIGQGFWFKYN